MQKLRSDVDSSWQIFGGKPVVGRVSESRLLLRKRLPMFVNNSFQPHLSATFLRDAGGTSITCKFVLHPSVLVFLALWGTGVLLIGGTIALDSIGELLRPNPPDDVWIGILIPPGMLAFAAVLTGTGWLFSSSDKGFLLKFVEKRLQATVRNP